MLFYVANSFPFKRKQGDYHKLKKTVIHVKQSDILIQLKTFFWTTGMCVIVNYFIDLQRESMVLD